MRIPEQFESYATNLILVVILTVIRAPAGGSQWSQLAFFFPIWLQVFPFGYTIFLIIPQINEVGSLVFNLAAKIATTFKIPEGALVIHGWMNGQDADE